MTVVTHVDEHARLTNRTGLEPIHWTIRLTAAGWHLLMGVYGLATAFEELSDPAGETN